MFHPTSKDWPAPHRTLVFALGVFVLMLVLAYGLFLRPRQLSLAKEKDAIQEKAMRFNELGMPRDPILLNEQLHRATHFLEGDPPQAFEGLDARNESVLAYATRSFDRKIRQDYPDTLAFIYGATRLDYKELQERIAAEFELDEEESSNQSFLTEKDDAQAQPVWQTIGKLWTIQELLTKSTAAGLRLAITENGNKALVALPVVAYTLDNTSDGSIFLLEFPVKATFTGTLDQFLAFTESLQTPDCFLPMKRLVIRTMPPEALIPGSENPVDQCEVSLQCSAFMRSYMSDSIPSESSDTEEGQE